MWRRIGDTFLALACAGAVALIDGVPTALAVRGPNVLINELMVNSQRVYDSRGEWIELYDAGDQGANLLGWTLSDDVTTDSCCPRSTSPRGSRVRPWTRPSRSSSVAGGICA